MKSQEHDLTPYEVAKAFYSFPNAQRDWKTVFKSLGIEHSKTWESRLRRQLDAYEQKNLVQHLVLREDEHYLPREPEIEEKIRKTFGLRAAIVVNISSLSRPGTNPSEQTKQQWNDYEEHIHEHLGVWGGRLISGLLRPRDILGTGGGRGSYYTAQHVFASPASLGAGNVLSLTGQIGTFPENRQHENYAHHVDADYVASFLHGGFQTAGKPVLIGSSITEKRNHPQSSENVTVALTGIGALEGRSRFKQFELFPRLHPVSALLRSINQIADEIEQLYQKKGLHFFHPVGDLCNWFFSVEPAGSEKMPHRKLLDSAIQKLNKKLLNTAHEELPKIAARGAVIAVAGGPHKTGAIGCALRNGKVEPRITHLVTDHYVAQDLLKQEELGLSSGHLP